MKKIVLSLALMMCALISWGQSQLIYKDQDAKTGLRSFGTSDIIVRNGMTDRHPLKVSLLAVESLQGWSYSLNISVAELTSRAVPEGSILLLRAKSGDVFELANTLSETQSRDWVGQWIEGTASKTYDNKASYIITREQLDALSLGVLKLRMQLSGGSFDTEYKKDRMGEAIKAHLAAIDSGISSGSDLRSGF